MVPRAAPMPDSGLADNGRSPAENREYAIIARRSQSRATELAAAERAWQGRRAKARERVTERDGELPPDVLERRVNMEIGAQLARARKLTLRRQRQQAAGGTDVA